MIDLKSLLILLCVLVSACLAQENQAKSGKKQTLCTEPRPQMCTMEYNPVCAVRDTGIRCVTTPCPSSERKTYSNACSACGDKKVTGFQPGACKSGELR